MFEILEHLPYSSLGRTKVSHATSLVLLGAKAKFLRRKPSVLVALEEFSERKSKPPSQLVKTSPKIGQNVPMVERDVQNVPKMIFIIYLKKF